MCARSGAVAKPAERPYSRVTRMSSARLNSPTTYAVIVLVCAAIGAVAAPRVDLLTAQFVALLVVLTVATGATIVLEHRKRRDALSPLSLAAIFYMLGMAGGALYFWLNPPAPTEFLEELPSVPDHGAITTALAIATLSWFMFVVGYRLNPLRWIAQAVPKVRASERMGSLGGFVLVLLAVGWIARLSLIADGRYFHRALDEKAAGGASLAVVILSGLPLLATALVGARYYLRGERRYRTPFWALTILEAAFTIPSGSRGAVVGVLLMLLVVRYYGSGRTVPIKTSVLVAGVIVFLVFPFALYYRNNASDYRQDTGTAFSQATKKTFDTSPGDAVTVGLAATFSRFADAASMAEIVRQGRDQFGHHDGATLAWVVEGFVPRAVVPNKVDPGQYGNEFGRHYGIIDSGDFGSSISVSQPGEFYLDLGLMGVILLAPLAGALYRLVGDYLAGRKDDPAGLAIYAVVAWPILSGYEVILANGWQQVVKTTLVYTLVIAVGMRLAGAGGRVPAGAPRMRAPRRTPA